MKTFFLCLSLLISTQVLSQETESKHGIDIKIHPMSFIAGMVNLEVEFLVTDKIGISPAFYYYEDDGEYEGDSTSITDFGLNLNYYYSGHSNSSAYVAPFIHQTKVDGESDFWDAVSDAGAGTFTSVGVSAGYRFKSESNLVIAAELGYAAVFSEVSSAGSTPIGTFTVGYSF